jgi:hypothetical protein
MKLPRHTEFAYPGETSMNRWWEHCRFNEITSERSVTVALALATTTRSANWRFSSDFARSYSTYATGNPKHFGSGGTREIAG